MPKLKEADDSQARIFLETFTPDHNAKFYEKLGFATATTAKEPNIDASYTLMIREPTRRDNKINFSKNISSY